MMNETETKDPNLLDLDQEGLFPKIQIRVRGNIYTVKKLTKPMWNKIHKLLERQKAGDMNAYYEQPPAVTDMPEEVAETLDFQEVRLIVNHITDKVFAPLAGAPEEQKNGSAPGEEKPAI